MIGEEELSVAPVARSGSAPLVSYSCCCCAALACSLKLLERGGEENGRLLSAVDSEKVEPGVAFKRTESTRSLRINSSMESLVLFNSVERVSRSEEMVE